MFDGDVQVYGTNCGFCAGPVGMACPAVAWGSAAFPVPAGNCDDCAGPVLRPGPLCAEPDAVALNGFGALLRLEIGLST